jgi:DNA modification methylase
MNNTFNIYIGDNQQILPTLLDNSIDSIVTDPPYELGFMGKSWDATGIAYNVEMWRECLRILKPGGHLLAFSGSRTYHRMAVAIEDAGFQIRDQIMWVYGSGFPKSMNISKAIDKSAGVEREETGLQNGMNSCLGGSACKCKTDGLKFSPTKHSAKTLPATAEAEVWDGWGTALKPAHEPIVLARKPLVGTVANNVLTYGTGGINIDGSRVGEGAKKWTNPRGGIWVTDSEAIAELVDNQLGRFPANFIHDGSDEVLELFPDTGKSTGGRIGKKSMGDVTNVPAGQFEAGDPGYGDSGSAARFFYCAKASKKDRNEGLDDFEEKNNKFGNQKNGEDLGNGLVNDKFTTQPQKNNHPTVKPTELMRYLCRLITPPNGTVLDPFTGSGSTGKAAVAEGFSFIGIEQSAEYVEIAKARITR